MSTPILQVVGYQDSGKTLFLERFIEEAAVDGFRIGVIKHHGHGSPDLYDEKKDTGRHRSAGAVVTGVSGGGVISIQATQEDDWQLERLLDLYKSFQLDLILVEGYKEKPLPKVLMIRTQADLTLLTMKNIRAIVTKEHIDTESIPTYSFYNMGLCIKELLKELKGE
ncbi:molybdopterin-guanine dinucleotide biosynthesis protein B [Guptibacillus hwajinpoensis]|uniref:molybdopterin-guanine dinucleotide biosynthesis protein B n=1 Tax=Guptibacillus hwajinpoensis TaxID=208199 RepID=UPI003734CDCB